MVDVCSSIFYYGSCNIKFDRINFISLAAIGNYVATDKLNRVSVSLLQLHHLVLVTLWSTILKQTFAAVRFPMLVHHRVFLGS